MKHPLLLAIAAFMFFSCQRDNYESEFTADDQHIVVNNEEIVPGWVRIKLKDNSPDLNVSEITTRGVLESGISDIDELAAKYGATKIRRVFREGGKYRERRRAAGLHLWYDLYFGDDLPTARAMSEFSLLDDVAIVTPIYVIRMEPVYSEPYQPVPQARVSDDNSWIEYPFDDPMLPEQWAYKNIGIIEDSRPAADMNLFDAWKKTAGHPDVIVAIFDSGFQIDHEDLQANVWFNAAELNGTAGVDDDDNGYIDDVWGWNFCVGRGTDLTPDSHGTHVAGTVAAVNNNGTGVGGVAGGTGSGDGVRIMNLIVSNNAGIDTYDLADAFAYAADNGAVIAQCSFSYSGSYPEVNDALDYFVANAGIGLDGSQSGPMQGGLLIAAAGNSNQKDRFGQIAEHPHAIRVAGLQPDFTKASYSNYGADITLSAPGGRDGGGDARILSTTVNNDYAWMSGTSMAAPHVSGMAALIVSHYGVGRPGLTAANVKQMLIDNVKDIYEVYTTKNSYYQGQLGSGLIDAARALYDDSGTAPGKVSELQVTASTDRSITTRFIAPSDGNGLSVYFFDVLYSTSDFTLSGTGTPQGVSRQRFANATQGGCLRKITIPELNNGTEYFFAVRAVDMYGNTGDALYFTASTVLAAVTAPVKLKDLADLYIPGRGSEYEVVIDLDEYFSDDDYQDYLTFSAESRNVRFVEVSVNQNKLHILPVAAGISTVTVTVSDQQGHTLTETFNVAVRTYQGDIQVTYTRSNGTIVLNVSDKVEGAADIRIYNSAGQRLVNHRGEISTYAPLTIDSGSLPTGHYTIEIVIDGRRWKENFFIY